MVETIAPEECEEILRLAAVPKEHHLRVARFIQNVRDITWLKQRRPGSANKALRCAASISDELCEAIEQFEKQLEDFTLDWFWYGACALDVNKHDPGFSLEELKLRLGAFAKSCRRLATPRPENKKPANRPSGSFSYPELRWLINSLHDHIVKRSSGKLTLWRDASGDLKGSLPSILRILRRSSPEIVPDPLPTYLTLRRMLHAAAHRNLEPPSPEQVRGGTAAAGIIN